MTEKEFYANCAVAAMQGIQECNIKIEGIAAIAFPEGLARLSFNIADAMLEEYRKRLGSKFENDFDDLKKYGSETEEE